MSKGSTAAINAGLSAIFGALQERRHLGTPDDEAKILQQAADLVFEIALHVDEQSTADEQCLDRVTVEILDANFLVPTTLHDAGNADGDRKSTRLNSSHRT